MEASPWPPTQPPDVQTPAEQAVDPAVWLGQLRTAHPDWGFVYDPFASRWVAMRGRYEVLAARTAFGLADALAAQHRFRTEGDRPCSKISNSAGSKRSSARSLTDTHSSSRSPRW